MKTRLRRVPVPAEPIDALPDEWLVGLPQEFVLGAGQEVSVLKIGLRSNPRSTVEAAQFAWPGLVPGDLTADESEYLDAFLLRHGSVSGLLIGLHRVWAMRWGSTSDGVRIDG